MLLRNEIRKRWCVWCLSLLLLLINSPLYAQQKTVSGVIQDETGIGLPGVTVQLKGTTSGTVTDLDGNYSLKCSPDDILVFSFIGYLTQEIPAGNQSQVNVTLMPDLQELEEVVVIGYGVQKKSDVTGALTSVSAEDIQSRPVQNALDALQGKAAGVDIQTNRRPGELPRLTIRGVGTINGDRDALVVVDGIVLMGDFNDINPNDIESIDILKDASATAIYGYRASNGVILVTTKKGKSGKVSVDYNGTYSFDYISSLTDWASAGEALDRKRAAFTAGGVYRSDYPDPALDIALFGRNDYWAIDGIRKAYQWNDPGTYESPVMRETTAEEREKGWPAQVPAYNSADVPSYDWIDLLTRTGYTNNQNVSITTGTDKSKVFFSIGYLGNKGAQRNQEYERISARLNADLSPTKWLTAGSSLAVSRSNQLYGSVYRTGGSTGAKDLYGQALSQYPITQPFDTAGQLSVYPGNNQGAPLFNPLIDLANTEDNRIRTYFQGNFYAQAQILPWLKYRINVGTGVKFYRRGQWQGSESTVQRNGDPASAYASYRLEEDKNWMLENLIFIDKSFGQHAFGLTLLQSAQENEEESIEASASGLIRDVPQWYDLGTNLTGVTPVETDYGRSTISSYMARLNYTLRNKYIITGTYRRDGSSVLPEGNKWDGFTSTAIAWKMEEEGFIKTIPVISQLKLRLGYGIVGNASVDPYQAAGSLRQYDYVFGTTVAVGYIPGIMPNRTIRWERQKQLNLGIDFGLFEDRMSGSIELFRSDITDLIWPAPVNPVTGFAESWTNIGRLDKRGMEITINSTNVSSRNFTWKSIVNLGVAKTTIVELINGKEDFVNAGLFIGKRISAIRRYKIDRIWQNTDADLEQMQIWRDSSSIVFEPGHYKPIDRNGDYKLDENDLFFRGSLEPKWTGGITNTLEYKNWKLSFFIYGRFGQKYIANLNPGGNSANPFVGYMRKASLDEYWSEDNPNAEWPALNVRQGNGQVLNADRVRDGTFFIVRNISFSYTFSRSVLDKLGASRLELYGQVLNPFIFGGEVVKAGINPDDNGNWDQTNSTGDPVGGTNNNTIINRSIVFGVRLGI